MAPKRYLTIDTSVKSNESHDFTLHLEKGISSEYRKICLKSIYIQHDSDVTKLFAFTVKESIVYKPLYIHCSILNKDDNYVNGRCDGSDVIAILYPIEPRSQKSMFIKFNSPSGKLIISHNNIRLHLTNFKGETVEHKNKYFIIYELEFF